MLKFCPRCNIDKPLDDFGNRIKVKGGKNYYCKECVNKHMRETYRTKHKELIAKRAKEDRKKRPEYYRDLWLRHQFKLPMGTYAAMYKAQNGLCACCGTPGKERRKGWRRLNLDHCHETGKIRDLLCANCNLGLGNLQHMHNFTNAPMTHTSRCWHPSRSQRSR